MYYVYIYTLYSNINTCTHLYARMYIRTQSHIYAHILRVPNYVFSMFTSLPSLSPSRHERMTYRVEFP